MYSDKSSGPANMLLRGTLREKRFGYLPKPFGLCRLDKFVNQYKIIIGIKSF